MGNIAKEGFEKMSADGGKPSDFVLENGYVGPENKPGEPEKTKMAELSKGFEELYSDKSSKSEA